MIALVARRSRVNRSRLCWSADSNSDDSDSARVSAKKKKKRERKKENRAKAEALAEKERNGIASLPASAKQLLHKAFALVTAAVSSAADKKSAVESHKLPPTEDDDIPDEFEYDDSTRSGNLLIAWCDVMSWDAAIAMRTRKQPTQQNSMQPPQRTDLDRSDRCPRLRTR